MKIELSEEELKSMFKTLIWLIMIFTSGMITIRSISHMKDLDLLKYNREMMEQRIEIQSAKGKVKK